MDEELNRQQAEEIVEKVKAAVKKGNIARIILKHNNNVFLNIPLNVGLVGTILGVAAAPWAVLATAIATLGFDCRIELEKTDGEIVEIFSRDVGAKAVNLGSAIVDEVKENFNNKDR